MNVEHWTADRSGRARVHVDFPEGVSVCFRLVSTLVGSYHSIGQLFFWCQPYNHREC